MSTKVGCVHGRFQPPHLDHLRYINAALGQCESLIIGIAQPDSPKLDACEADPHRAQLTDNPLTYPERVEAIRAMLLACGTDMARITFSKFPIDRSSELANFVNTNVTCFTTVMNDWNLKKIDILRDVGYAVEILWDRRGLDHIEGSNIRRLIRLKDDSWKDLVHPAVVQYLETSNLIARVSNSGPL